MKLYSSPSSPFARKCRVVARELEISLEEVNINPMGNAELRVINPLGKIPALVTDEGHAIFDSRVICEYLNGRAHGTFFPAADRIRAQTLQALADGIADAAVARTIESRRPAERQDPDTMARYLRAVTSGIDALEVQSETFSQEPTIGEVAAACALSYVDFRLPDLAWSKSHAKLAAWYQAFARRPAMAATALANL